MFLLFKYYLKFQFFIWVICVFWVISSFGYIVRVPLAMGQGPKRLRSIWNPYFPATRVWVCLPCPLCTRIIVNPVRTLDSRMEFRPESFRTKKIYLPQSFSSRNRFFHHSFDGIESSTHLFLSPHKEYSLALRFGSVRTRVRTFNMVPLRYLGYCPTITIFDRISTHSTELDSSLVSFWRDLPMKVLRPTFHDETDLSFVFVDLNVIFCVWCVYLLGNTFTLYCGYVFFLNRVDLIYYTFRSVSYYTI